VDLEGPATCEGGVIMEEEANLPDDTQDALGSGQGEGKGDGEEEGL